MKFQEDKNLSVFDPQTENIIYHYQDLSNKFAKEFGKWSHIYDTVSVW